MLSGIHVWLTPYRDIGAPQLARLEQLLSPDERMQQQRFHFAEDRLRYLVTRALVRTVLSRYAPVAPANWAFTANAYGRPEIASQHGVPALRFNLSHSKGMIALAVSCWRELGVDIENTGWRPAPFDLAGHYFAAAERAELARLAPAQRQARFYACWTLKEAYAKARGIGLSFPFAWLDCSFPAPMQLRLSIDAASGDAAARWQFWQCRPAPDYTLALCAQRTGATPPAVVLHMLTPGTAQQRVEVAWASSVH